MCLSKMWDSYKHLMLIKKEKNNKGFREDTVFQFPKWLEPLEEIQSPCGNTVHSSPDGCVHDEQSWNHLRVVSGTWQRACCSRSQSAHIKVCLPDVQSTTVWCCPLFSTPQQTTCTTVSTKLSSFSSAQNHCFLLGNTGIHPVQPQSSTGGSSAHLQMHFDISDNVNCWQVWTGPHG